jgi:hypothetical protein
MAVYAAKLAGLNVAAVETETETKKDRGWFRGHDVPGHLPYKLVVTTAATA